MSNTDGQFINYYRNQYIKCPHCDHEDHKYHERKWTNEEKRIVDCNVCTRTFIVFCEIEYRFTTKDEEGLITND